MTLKLLSVVVFIAAIYPLALCLQIGIDWLWGDAEFMRLFLQDSKRRLVQQMLSDWTASSLWSAGAFALAAAIGHGLKRVTRQPLVPWLVIVASAGAPALLGMPTLITLLYAVACALYALWTGLLHWSKLHWSKL